MISLVVLVLLFYVLYPVYGRYRYARPPRIGVPFPPPKDHGAVFREVTFSSDDGLRLSGWYAPSKNGAAVILVHGYGGNRMAMLVHAKALAGHGYGVLFHDVRAHGKSEGRLFDGAWAAVGDVMGALAFLQSRSRINSDQIGALGVSLGAQIVLYAAAQTDGIRSVVADGPGPVTLSDLLPPQSVMDWFYLPMNWVTSKLLDWGIGGRQPVPPSLVKKAEELSLSQVLFISAGRSGEQRHVRKLLDAVRAPKTLWEIPEAHHAGGWLARPEEYPERIVGFFDETLLAS